MLLVTWCENRPRDRFVVSPTGDVGIAQINGVHDWRWQGRDWTNPVHNLEVAFEVFQDAGWSWRPWAPSNHCHGLSYIGSQYQ